MNEFVFAVSRVGDGPMARFFDNEEAKVFNSHRFVQKYGLWSSKAVMAGFEHGANIGVLDENTPAGVMEHTDAIVVLVPKRPALITVADCFPVALEDPVRKIGALVHAGWRGAIGEIVPRTIEKMRKFGSEPGNMVLRLGPGIRACDFKIQKDGCVEAFREAGYGGFIAGQNGVYFADLPRLIASQAEEMGVERILDEKICTVCTGIHFSFRRDKTDDRNIALFAIC